MNPTIALMNDFGLQDTYVGIMKGVMLNICSQAHFVDLTHHVPPQNVRQAAFMLMNAYSYFPYGTIFLVVMDPGVGSTRRPIAVRTPSYTFIAPDNGVLSYALASETEIEVIELTNAQYQLTNRSNTFHGRDIFAPAAAYLASGISFNALGDIAEGYIQLPLPQVEVNSNRVIGEIISIDHFGNLITSIGKLKWQSDKRLKLYPAFLKDKIELPVYTSSAVVIIGDERLVSIQASYSEAQRSKLLALIGSTEFLEIAVNQGNAAQRLGLMVGDKVELEVGEVNAAIYH